MSRRLRNERGVATLEAAIILPILLLILLAIIQGGVFIFTVADVRQATRAGGRVISISRNDPNGEQSAENKVAASLSGEINSSKLAYTFSSSPPWTPGATVKMTVTYPDSFSVMGINIAGPITATTVVDVE
jgi:Flp pilus assembly protein TadG